MHSQFKSFTLKFKQAARNRVAAIHARVARLIVGVAVAQMAVSAHAGGGGFDRVNTVFDNVNGILIAAGAGIMTMCLLWCGYKVMFKGASFEDISKPLIGGIILGGAPTLAGFLLG